jgi:predicted PurR-regulated permease PerM
MSDPTAARRRVVVSTTNGSAGAERPAHRGYCELLRALQGAVLFAFGLFLLYRMAGPISTLLLFFLMVFILSAVLNPVVARLERRGVPRIVGALGIVLSIAAVLGVVGWLALPPLAGQIAGLFRDLPAREARLERYYLDLTRQVPGLQGALPPPDELMSRVVPFVSRLLGQVGRYTMNVLVGLFSMLLLMVLLVFTLSNPAPLVAGLLGAVPSSQQSRVERAFVRILEQLKNWAFGSLKLGGIVSVMTGLGLWAISGLTGHQMPSILLFSVIAGIGELVPNIGPILSALPPVLIALTIDPMLGLWVAVLFLVIQQLENNLIVPTVMGKSLDLHPVSLIFTVLVMGSLFGLLGAILAVPVAAIVKVCWEELYLLPRDQNPQALLNRAEAIVSTEGQHLEEVAHEQNDPKRPGGRVPRPPARRATQ